MTPIRKRMIEELQLRDSASTIHSYVTAVWRLSGKAMARTGLRMMPTFPLPPLKFRTAGFPRYGFKAGLSDGAFPHGDHAQLVCHRPSCSLRHRSSLRSVSEHGCACKHRRSSGLCRSTPGALAPVRVMLSRSIIT